MHVPSSKAKVLDYNLITPGHFGEKFKLETVDQKFLTSFAMAKS